MNKIEMGKQYRTRDGEDVRVLCTDGPDAEYPVIAIVGKKINSVLIPRNKYG